MRNVPAILFTATLAAGVVAGCAKDEPYLSDVAEIAPEPTPAPATAPVAAPTAIQPPLVPIPLPATQAATPTNIAFDILPAPSTATIATTAPATLPVTQPATRPAGPATSPAGDISATFLRELADLAQGQPAPEPAALAGLSVQEQRTLAAVLQGIGDFREQLKTQTLGQSAIALLEMADRIRSVSPLRISDLALCTKVEGFGLYDVIEARFPANREFSLVIYCELAGFSSRVGDRAMWETRLSQETRLFDSEGALRWHDKPSTVVDACRHRRRDFYVARVIRLPAGLPAGKYVIQTQITDQISREMAESAAGIELVAGQR